MPRTTIVLLGIFAALNSGVLSVSPPTPSLNVHAEHWTDDDGGSGDFRPDPMHTPTTSPKTPIATSTEMRRPIRPVQLDLDDFINLIPADEVRAKIAAYFKADADVQTALAFVNGKDFAALRTAFDVSAVQSIDHWFRSRGVNIKALAHRIDDLLGVSKLRPVAVPTSGFGHMGMESVGWTTTIGGLNGMLEEIFALIPQDEIFILFFEKLDSSIAFAELVEKMGSAEFYAYYDSLKRSTDLRKMSAELSKHKIDIRKIVELFQSHFLFGAH